MIRSSTLKNSTSLPRSTVRHSSGVSLRGLGGALPKKEHLETRPELCIQGSGSTKCRKGFYAGKAACNKVWPQVAPGSSIVVFYFSLSLSLSRSLFRGLWLRRTQLARGGCTPLLPPMVAPLAPRPVKRLDPHRRNIAQRLYRQHCRDMAGSFLKDLREIGRPLDRSMLVDNSPVSLMLCPDNGVLVSSWTAEASDDRELLELLLLLQDRESDTSAFGRKAGGKTCRQYVCSLWGSEVCTPRIAFTASQQRRAASFEGRHMIRGLKNSAVCGTTERKGCVTAVATR